MRRFADHAEPLTYIKTLAATHPSAVAGATLYPATVKRADTLPRVLKSGHNNRKIGRRVAKGAWRGMEIYTLSLEERATCPRSCRHWLDCFGNKMPFVDRVHAGAELEATLDAELRMLARRHRRGFVVRLHIVGDFYSAAYVERWLRWLDEIPRLHVFGYTAWPESSEIGGMVRAAARARWSRFAVRTSNRPHPEMSTHTLYEPPADHTLPDGAIVCPAQTGRSDCCATCALCWGTRRNIAFLAH